MVEWLPSVSADDDPWGEDRPVRPDLPLLRWFSFTKLHSIQLGVFTGLLFGWFQQMDSQLEIGLLGLSLVWLLFDERRVSKCGHRTGFHDARQKPWYFLTACLLALGLSVLLDGVVL